MRNVIEIRQLSRTFPAHKRGPAVHAVDHVNMVQAEGEFLAIMGPSGCGKSTLLNIIAGFDKADDGVCLINGAPVNSVGPDRGVVFQEYALFPWMTVENNVIFAMKAAGKWSPDAPSRVSHILERMGVAQFRHAFPKDLSGGMRQRVAIARILAIDSPIMLMDEPFGALDALTRSEMQEELMELWSETHKTIFFVTHGVDEAVYLADRILVMTPRPGRVVLDLKIDLPRPRDITDPRFNEYKREILNVIHPTLVSGRKSARHRKASATG
ncbi:MAG TPA: ABC transporter ATP-binding protein [Bryobacteraceae bacterium]|nr:ABC transporter ATP-binding protein [Bryobacteraceae bacterium]